jgi:hypothetical protein
MLVAQGEGKVIYPAVVVVKERCWAHGLEDPMHLLPCWNDLATSRPRISFPPRISGDVF